MGFEAILAVCTAELCKRGGCGREPARNEAHDGRRGAERRACGAFAGEGGRARGERRVGGLVGEKNEFVSGSPKMCKKFTCDCAK